MKPRALVGALAGAIAGAALWFWLVKRGTLIEISWIPILIGTLAGAGARLLAEPMRHAWQRGGVVAAIAISITYFTQQATSYVIEHEFALMAFNISDVFFPRGPVQTLREPNRRPPTPVVQSLRLPVATPAPEAELEIVTEEQPVDPAAAAERPAFRLTPPPAASISDDEIKHGGTAVDASQAVAIANVGDAPAPDAQSLENVTANIGRRPHKPGEEGPSMLIALSYALGTLTAYLLGRGPEIRGTAEEPVATT